jgi:transcriptional regulator with XRE-family HTH domain
MTMATNFVTWLTKEMEDRGWNNSELARRAGLVPSAVSQVIAGNRGTGPEFCRSVARALNLPPETVFRKAGLLPSLQGPEEDVTFGELLDVVRNLSVEERVMVLEFAEFLHHGRREKGKTPGPPAGGAGAPQTRPANTGAASTK